MIEMLLERIASYPALFIACSFSGLGVPMPEDVPLLAAGLQLAEGRFEWAPALLTAFAGVTLRDTLAWLLGRTLGNRLFEARWFRRVIPPKKIDQARSMISEHGAMAVLGGRFFFGFRVPVFLTAGASGIPLRQFLAWDLLGMLVTVPLVIGLGYAFGPPIIRLASIVLPSAGGVWVLLLAIAAAVYYQRRKQRGSK